jgi:hypothetical protein
MSDVAYHRWPAPNPEVSVVATATAGFTSRCPEAIQSRDA